MKGGEGMGRSMKREMMMKVALLYLGGVFLLTFYGIEVCPYLETLPPAELGGIIAGAFLTSYVVRFLIFGWMDRGVNASAEVDIRTPWLYLRLDLGIWILAGLLITVWNLIHYDFPVGSGLKVVLGCATLGMFSSVYLALRMERALILDLAGEDVVKGLKKGRFLSISTKFLVFIGVALSLISTVMILVVYHDFRFVLDTIADREPFQLHWVINEILFVFGVLLAGCLAVAWQYNHNLKLILDIQLKRFNAVERGNYDTLVPVVSHDELSLIAEGANQMIVGLREKRRIKEAFGKYMSRPIADFILNSEQETHLGGRQIDVAVLFTDIRNFTPLSEQSTPQEVVNVLNEYFSLVVEAIHNRQGVLDKFIGDCAMGVFGLDDSESPCDNAMKAALDIRRGLSEINHKFESQGLPAISIGTGVHFGPVVAGNIGTKDRLEYTVIGDTVNTASRLESLTKEITSTIAVSTEVYSRVGKEVKSRLTYLGSYELKGKTAPCPVYGLGDKDS
jgi:class 3 adenylate cyclase